MRAALPGLYLFVAILLPNIGTAQFVYRPTPAPRVTAADAIWQINGEPVFFAGSFYYPTGPTVFFDGQLMARVGEYLTVPLYADTTHEAFSRVLVPIGDGVMKPYDRRRAGRLSGTDAALRAAPATVERLDPVGTSGSVMAQPPIARRAMQSVPRPTTNTGISVLFQGARWVSDGPAVPFSPDRFAPIGDHHGFPVYRDKSGSSDTIYVTVVADGPVAPYTRR